ncbi:MAG: hypothetical protein QW292_06695 [Candidatus Parvarchaeota archaeon]
MATKEPKLHFYRDIDNYYIIRGYNVSRENCWLCEIERKEAKRIGYLLHRTTA